MSHILIIQYYHVALFDNFLLGMTEEKLRIIKCVSCGASGVRVWGTPPEYCQIGLWPLHVGSWTFLDFPLMNFMSTLQHLSPVTSLTSLLETLKFTHKFPSVVSFHQVFSRLN